MPAWTRRPDIDNHTEDDTRGTLVHDEVTMDLSFTPAQETFRRQVRAWLKANVPQRDKDASGIEYGDAKRVKAMKAWQRKLYDAGYVAMGWPQEFGGRGPEVGRP